MTEDTTPKTDAETVHDALVDAATAPSSVSNETGSVTTRSVDELIKLHRYLASVQAVDRSDLGLRFSSFMPPGAV